MRPSYFTAVLLVLAVGATVSGCQRPFSVPPTGASTVTLQPIHVIAQYAWWYWNPCPNHLVTFEKDGNQFTNKMECTMSSTPTPVVPTSITELQFNQSVYVTDAFLADPSPYVEIPVSSVPGAPAETSHCYQTPDTVDTLCHDGNKVITYKYYNGMALGIYDVNNSMVLVSYTQE